MFTHFRVSLKDYYHTGSPFPSLPTFAKVMTREFRQSPGPRRILEVGPGAGPMTAFIVDSIRDGDVFDVVEVNSDFTRRLEERFLEPARRRHPGATIRSYCDLIQDAPLEGNYDFIVSSLPLNNFDAQTVRTILNRLQELLACNGRMNFFEYAGIRKLARPFKKRPDRARLGEIGAILREFDEREGTSREVCVFNLPPALKRSYQKEATDGDRSAQQAAATG